LTAHPLIAYLFERHSRHLRGPVAAWLASSPRFATFVEKYKDKIRKKIRVLNGEEMALDLLAELETAYMLLSEKRFELAYEPYAGEKIRGPDFAVIWRTTLIFNVEVTRLRSASSAVESRLADTVCEKLDQMLPAMINLLAIVGSGQVLTPSLAAVMQGLKLLAEKRDPSLYRRQGYQTPGDFFKGYERLSGILWRQDQGSPVILWNNPQARHPLPPRVQNLIAKTGKTDPSRTQE